MHTAGQLAAAWLLLYGAVTSAAPFCPVEGEIPLEQLADCARAGDADAQLALAKYFHQQPDNMDNEFLAATWYLAAAKNGNIEAQYQIGLMFLDGRGVTDDAIEGFDWIAEAARQGHPAATEVFNYLLENPEPMEC